MQPSNEPAPPVSSNKRLPWILLGLLVIVAAVMILTSDDKPRKTEATGPATLKLDPAMMPRMPLADSAPVIGVSLNGRHRAYPLQLLMRPDTHVVNDLYDSTPVTVTFCDVDQCVRVFTDPARREKLDIAVGGSDKRRTGKMLLKTNAVLYWQDNAEPLEATTKTPFPFGTLEHQRTTWGEWRTLHPDAERYIGDGQFLPNQP